MSESADPDAYYRDISHDHVRRGIPKGAASGLSVAYDNFYDSFEQFLLEKGEKKVEMKLDTRMPNTSIFTFNKEDHTLGNLLRARLLQDRRVTFAAYKVPHPLFPTFELRVQTDGSLTPKEALLTACRDSVSDLNTLSREFTKEYELRKMANEGRESAF